MIDNEIKPWHKLALSLVALSVLVILVASFWKNNAVVFGVLILATATVFIRSRRKKEECIPFIVGGLLGPTMEIIIIHFGAWEYANPTIGGIPIWLPLLWGLTGVFLMKITRWFVC